MSEPTDGEEYPPMPVRRVDVAVALARMEAKLDIAIAQHQARLEEHGRSIAENKAAIARLDGRLGIVEQRQAATTAVDESKPAPVPLSGYVSVGVSLVLLVLYLIEKFGQ